MLGGGRGGGAINVPVKRLEPREVKKGANEGKVEGRGEGGGALHTEKKLDLKK